MSQEKAHIKATLLKLLLALFIVFSKSITKLTKNTIVPKHKAQHHTRKAHHANLTPQTKHKIQPQNKLIAPHL